MASSIQIIGALSVAVGVGLVYLPAGIIVAGILALVFGISLEKK
jgi:hypothetical protein